MLVGHGLAHALGCILRPSTAPLLVPVTEAEEEFVRGGGGRDFLKAPGEGLARTLAERQTGLSHEALDGLLARSGSHATLCWLGLGY
ncbi:hypothetical protein BK826_08060 [Rothia kristinae]|uniref:Uncharacterized protein n=1 Tax=Rothia kristinae TaxID=37923 RepID=A0A1S2N0C6_9MICC|nr:hypothetical protein BK826_08060 [Rothia kristinae]